jgi:hypothetical protein
MTLENSQILKHCIGKELAQKMYFWGWEDQTPHQIAANKSLTKYSCQELP